TLFYFGIAKNYMSKLLQYALFVGILTLLASGVSAQQMFFSYKYEFERAMITEPPELTGALEVDYPEAARKNGVEGAVKVTGTLGENGKVRDIVIVNNLGHGTGEAVAAGLQKFTFKPAKFNGTPTAMKMTVIYTVSLYYDESDKDVSKPKIVDKPLPAYPEAQRAEGMKGKVMVSVLLKATGELQILSVNSVMHKDFDKAAEAAAKNLKFSPAVHKKSKQPVSQAMTVEYSFKP
ncbi:MAG: energy transducer TonB, partial [Pyrinomonadaceae bacterium]